MSVSGNDTHADTIRDALFWEPTYKQAKNNGYALAALDALVAERDRLQAAYDAEWQEKEHPFDKSEFDALFADRERERARADRAEGALRGLMDALLIDEDGNLVTPMNGWASAWVEAQGALSAGSGGREDRPPPPRPPVIKPPSVEVIGPPAPWQRARKRGRGAA